MKILPIHPFRRHPTSGLPVRAVGFRTDGSPLWPLLGSEGDGATDTATAQTGTQGGAGGTTDSGQGATGSGSTSDDKGAAQSDGDKPTDATVSREEFDQLRRQLSAADKKREEAERRAKEFEDRDKSELDKATERAAQLEAERDSAREEAAQLRLERTMLADPTYGADKWHDPEDVLVRLGKAVKDGQVTIKEDGKVEGVTAFLKKLSIEKRYLLKSEGGSAATSGATGSAMNGDKRGASGESKEAKRARLEAEFPALRRR
jgi:hypothetical protein